jgi:hypothetical protein
VESIVRKLVELLVTEFVEASMAALLAQKVAQPLMTLL